MTFVTGWNGGELSSLRVEKERLAKEIDTLARASGLPLLSVARLKRQLRDVNKRIVMIEGSFLPDTIA
jgi:hypothetical protein